MAIRMGLVGSLAAILLVARLSQAQAGLVIGSFDYARGGDTSIAEAAWTSNCRASIQEAFPGVTFSTTTTLTPAYLDTIDVLMITSVRNGSAGITPLTSAEQTALRSFVASGGGALLFTDGDYFETANESVVDAFGVNVSNTYGDGQTVSIVDPDHPVANGPFGQVSTAFFYYPGYFWPSSETEMLGHFTVYQMPGLLVTDPGTLSPESGGVVFFSDISPLENPWYNSYDNKALVRNAIAFAASATLVPEPSTLALLNSLLAIGFAGAWWTRKRRSCSGQMAG